MYRHTSNYKFFHTDVIIPQAEVIFRPFDLIQCVSLQIINDLILELDESFILTLESLETAVIIAQSTATLIVLNDDSMYFC